MPDITKDPEAIPDCVIRLLEVLEAIVEPAGAEDWEALYDSACAVESHYGITTEPDDEDDVDPEEEAA